MSENHRASVARPDLGARRRAPWSRPFAGPAIVLVLALAEHASAAALTDQSVRGVWGFSAAGAIVPPAVPATTPAVAVGVITFDGAGSCSFTDTINIGGTSASRTSATCSYAVNPDGTGVISVLFPGDPGPTPLSFVIVDNKREIRFIRTDLGVASGVAKRR